jgi:hypothetical protein
VVWLSGLSGSLQSYRKDKKNRIKSLVGSYPNSRYPLGSS